MDNAKVLRIMEEILGINIKISTYQISVTPEYMISDKLKS